MAAKKTAAKAKSTAAEGAPSAADTSTDAGQAAGNEGAATDATGAAAAPNGAATDEPAAAPKPPKAPRAAATFRVVSPLEHDGKRLEVGADIELTEAQAKPLLGHTVEPVGADDD